jgi:cytochrome bd-type quinol oxidase subunit 2
MRFPRRSVEAARYAPVMSEATCAVLSAVYPLILITIVLEQRSVHLEIRRRTWFRRATLMVVVASLAGLALSVVGVQTGGLAPLFAAVNWVAGAVSLLGLGALLLAIIATLEDEEDRATRHAAE